MSSPEQNWNNFCKYHALGDWHGLLTKYLKTGEIIDSFKCIRSLHLANNQTQVNHQNHYIYSDGTTNSQTFGPHKIDTVKALYLDNSFSWGFTKVKINIPLAFETGFSYDQRRASVTVIYDVNGALQEIITIVEHLNEFKETFSSLDISKIEEDCQGISRQMTPEKHISSPVIETWQRLETLGENYTTLYLAGNISVSCPSTIKENQEFSLFVDWLITSSLLQRGIREFKSSEFVGFTLQNFTLDVNL